MKVMICAAVFLSGAAMAYAGCPEGFTMNTGLMKCETAPACPPGFSLHNVDDICFKKSNDGKCPQGSTYNQQEKQCEREPVCPAGTVFDPNLDKCLKK